MYVLIRNILILLEDSETKEKQKYILKKSIKNFVNKFAGGIA